MCCIKFARNLAVNTAVKSAVNTAVNSSVITTLYLHANVVNIISADEAKGLFVESNSSYHPCKSHQ